jgi:NTE family protein
MGALVGGLAAAGKLDAYIDWVRPLTQRDLLKLLDPLLPSAPGAIRAERIYARISEILQGVQIEDLSIPFTAVATDLTSQREVWFQSGPLDVAIRASIAIPSVITPIVVNGRLLCDGGVLNPVPIEPTTATPSDVTVAVSLSGPRRGAQPSGPLRESAEARPVSEWIERLGRGLLDNGMLRPLVEWFVGDADTEPKQFDHVTTLNILEVSGMALETMSAMVERFRVAAHPPDITINVPRDLCGTLDFHRADEVIAAGRELAAQALDHWAADQATSGDGGPSGVAGGRAVEALDQAEDHDPEGDQSTDR